MMLYELTYRYIQPNTYEIPHSHYKWGNIISRVSSNSKTNSTHLRNKEVFSLQDFL